MMDNDDDVVMEFTQHSTNIQHKALSARSTSIWRKVAAKNGLSLCAAELRPFLAVHNSSIGDLVTYSLTH